MSVEEDRRLRRSPPVDMRPERERRREREQPRCREVAGGTAAECAAVCCCFPCAVVELVALSAVRVPAALCRRAFLARRRRRRAAAKRKEMEELLAADAASLRSRATAAAKASKKADATEHWPDMHSTGELAEVEKEVWASFQGAGFWRSPSQREVRR
ncbi:uncharacterized protein LOC133904630 [Phragmites australis]|uniref:uncharacterized protein LOC133904630 n=1 Tax=Phragmites australis TaxID=29695 RepID=UPI002D79CCF5|nr:uncharacterized protein LOC133904630 [Phragmites australis]